MSDRIDLTVALTVHAETVIAGPTMLSAEAAIAAAERAGIRVERLIGFDTPKAQAEAYFSRPEFAAWKAMHYEFRDQGKTRNELAKVASGHWLAFLDGDDLFSENWLVEAVRCLKEAEQAGEQAIVHPELNWVFDAWKSIFTKPAQDDPIFSPYYFYTSNYYDALCMAARQVWLDCPYADRAVARGFAYEDWQWAIETMHAGWKHVVARDTIIFKRRRDASQTIEARTNAVWIRAQESLLIDRVAALGTDGVEQAVG